VSIRTSGEVVQAARELSETTATEIGELSKLRNENTNSLNESTRLRDEEALRLSLALLPELSPAALANAARLTGCPSLSRQNLIAERDEDRRARTAELAETETDSRFTDADRLLAHLAEQRLEAVDLSAPGRDVMTRAQHQRLNRLIESGYDTQNYKTAFWELAFYDDWKAGDEILEKFPDIDRFASLREKLVQTWKTVEEFDRKIAELDSQTAEITAVQRRGEELRYYLEHLDEAHLERAHDCIRAYLLDGDLAAIGQCLSAEPALAESFKKLRGLAAKTLYLERINTQLDAEQAQLEEVRSKADHDIMKWQRPKRLSETLNDTDYDKRYFAPRERIRRRRERYGRMTDTIRDYDDYGRVTFTGNLLWWDVFTDGRFDGDFIPEVTSFHQNHPDYHGPHHLPDAEGTAAATEAGLLHGDSGSGRLVDPS